MRSKKVIVLCHCILNQNSVINDWERARGAFPLAGPILNSGIGIIQLPCPELIFKGLDRPPLEYEDYNTEEYRELSRQLLSPYVWQLKEYVSKGYELQGIIGINKSPSCSITGQRGVFMEEFFQMCSDENIELRHMEIPEDYHEEKSDSQMISTIEKFITEE